MLCLLLSSMAPMLAKEPATNAEHKADYAKDAHDARHQSLTDEVTRLTRELAAAEVEVGGHKVRAQHGEKPSQAEQTAHAKVAVLKRQLADAKTRLKALPHQIRKHRIEKTKADARAHTLEVLKQAPAPRTKKSYAQHIEPVVFDGKEAGY